MLSESVMGIDSCTTLPWPPNKRPTLTPVKLRLREERKKIIRTLEAKYRSIDDHEKAMRKFVLIRNNLRRLQREAREDKLSRNRASVMESRASHLSPSYLSASRSPSPLGEYPYVDSPAPFAKETDEPSESAPPKRPRLFFFDDDKENEMETESQENSASPKESKGITDDAQDILRDLYESCSSEGLSRPSSPSVTTTPSFAFQPNTSSCSHSHSSACTYSVSMSTSCTVSSSSDCSSTSNSIGISNNSSEGDWHNKPAPYQFTCGHTSLLGNGLQSVVFHSLITSLES